MKYFVCLLEPVIAHAMSYYTLSLQIPKPDGYIRYECLRFTTYALMHRQTHSNRFAKSSLDYNYMISKDD